MSDHTPFKRFAQLAALTIGGGVAMTFAMSSTASADEVVVQDADVTNTGVGVANSGGNTAVGNDSQNTAAAGQVAAGGLASNQADVSNESNGSASIETGDATGIGNHSETEVAQKHTGNGGPGLSVVVQDTDVTNAGIGIANSGGNDATGNDSQNAAICGQLAVGFLASNSCDASNSSDGTAAIETGDATGIGNHSKTKVGQDADTGPGAGLAIVLQDSDVLNLGFGLANTGNNDATGNDSNNLGITLQGAFGAFASNNASLKNSSNGKAYTKTGNATGIGNWSDTEVSQDADVDPAALAVVVQNAPVVNAGIGIANSGNNTDVGNSSANVEVVIQVSFGFLASNVADVDSWSDGFAFTATGDATGIGNQSATKVEQNV